MTATKNLWLLGLLALVTVAALTSWVVVPVGITMIAIARIVAILPARPTTFEPVVLINVVIVAWLVWLVSTGVAA